jgi:hypothetical protein
MRFCRIDLVQGLFAILLAACLLLRLGERFDRMAPRYSQTVIEAPVARFGPEPHPAELALHLFSLGAARSTSNSAEHYLMHLAWPPLSGANLRPLRRLQIRHDLNQY